MQLFSFAKLALPLVLTLALPFAGGALAQDEDARGEQGLAKSDDPYPPARVETLIRYYTLDGDEVDMEKLEGALADLGEGAAVLYGPVNTLSKPDHWFVAIETPAEVSDKTAMKAAKKGTGRAEQLLFTALLYDTSDLQIPNQGRRAGSVRDLVVNMASEMRWVEITSTALLFFYTDGIDAEAVVDRFDKLRAQKPRSDYTRDCLKHTVIWNMAATPGTTVKKSGLRKLEKTIAKLPGVASASVDEDLLRLFLTLRVDDLPVSGPGMAPKAREAEEDDEGAGGGGGRGGRGGPALPGNRISFVPRVNVNPILDAIEKAKLVIEDEGAESEVAEGEAGDH